MLLGVRHALVGDVLVRGDVRVEDGRVAAVGVVPAGASGLAAPGFVDLQVNGFGGVDFLAAEPPDYRTAGAAMAATGVTAYLPTFISSPDGAYDHAVAAAAAAACRRPAGAAHPRRAPRGPLPVAALAGRARPAPPAGAEPGADRATRTRRSDRARHPGARARRARSS